MFDLTSEEFLLCRPEALDRLREEAPVIWHEPVPPSPNGLWGTSGYWSISRHEDVQTAGTDTDAFSNAETYTVDRGPGGFTYEVNRRRLSARDAPDHTVLRRLYGKAFRPSSLKPLEAQLAEKVAEMVDGIEARVRDGETVDFATGFAYELPTYAVSLLLGVPEEVLGQFAAQYNAGMTGIPEDGEEAVADYFRQLVKEREASPTDDLTSTLIEATKAGNPYLSLDELYYVLVGLYIAGHLTTTNLLSWSLVELERRPDTKAVLRSDPGEIPGFIEEVLRLDPPVPSTMKTAVTDVPMGGQVIRAGDRVRLMYAAANRDPRAFQRPGEFDISRRPNPHLSFSHGAHFCLGAPLARMETRIAVEELVRRDLPLNVHEGERFIGLNGFRSLPLSLAD